MIRHIGTILIVSLVTALIWTFAESETLRSREIACEAAFEPDLASDRVVDVASGGGRVRLAVVVEGSPASVDQAERLMRRPLKIPPYADGIAPEPGPQVLDLRRVLRSQAELRSLNVTIKSVDPPTLDAVVEQLATREVPVHVVVSSGELDGNAEVRPARVQLRVPAKRAGEINDQTAALAMVDDAALARLVPGRRETLASVRVVPPPALASDPHASVLPPAVEVQLTLRGRASSITLPSVPVHIQIAPGEQPNWDIKVELGDQFITDVTVTGPSDIIKQIADKTLPVVALLPLSYQELEGGKVTSKEVVFANVPTPLKFECADRVVNFTVTRRGAGK